jgi:translation initiation factor IF-3
VNSSHVARLKRASAASSQAPGRPIVAMTEMMFTHCKIIDLGQFRLDREEKQSKDKRKRFVTVTRTRPTETKGGHTDGTIKREE